MKDKFGYKLFDPIAPSFSHWDNWSFHKKLFRFSLICFFWIEHIPLKISWKHGIIDIGIIFSNPLPRMHWLRANHNLWKRHPYEINESYFTTNRIPISNFQTNSWGLSLAGWASNWIANWILQTLFSASCYIIFWVLYIMLVTIHQLICSEYCSTHPEDIPKHWKILHCTSSAQNITYLYSYCYSNCLFSDCLFYSNCLFSDGLAQAETLAQATAALENSDVVSQSTA